MEKDTTTSIASFIPIRRSSVTEHVIEGFKQALINGELHPGQRLPNELEMAEQFGVGRSAIRETMKMLAVLGVVTIQQGDGTYITDRPSPSLLNPLVFAILLENGMSSELLELRALVQTGYFQLAAWKATEEDWQRIEDAESAYEEQARHRVGDVDRLVQLDLDVHFAILAATHNPLVAKICRPVEELFLASIRTVLSSNERVEQGIARHREIIHAIKRGEPADIRIAVERSLEMWGQVVQGQPGPDKATSQEATELRS